MGDRLGVQKNEKRRGIDDKATAVRCLSSLFSPTCWSEYRTFPPSRPLCLAQARITTSVTGQLRAQSVPTVMEISIYIYSIHINIYSYGERRAICSACHNTDGTAQQTICSDGLRHMAYRIIDDPPTPDAREEPSYYRPVISAVSNSAV